MSTLTSQDPISFDAKDPAEVVTLAFDFAALSGALALSAPVVSVTVASGTDASPSAILSGAASVSGTQVLQRVQAGVLQVTYKLKAQIDLADGSRYVLAGLLPVRAS